MKKTFLSLLLLLVSSLSAQDLFSPISYNADAREIKGGKKYRFFSGHVNYKDGAQFRRINTRLSYDSLLTRWSNNRASYFCAIPQFADGWIDFTSSFEGANIGMKARPVAAHIEGSLQFEKDGNNFVLYPDAFGKGIDFRIYPEEDVLKKVVVINNPPLKAADLVFDFELELPIVKSIRDEVGRSWSTAERFDFTQRSVIIGEESKGLFFREAFVWDSKDKREPVKIELFRSKGKVYLRKTVPLSFLESATFPVYTDHPTSYYSGAGDGYVEFSSTDEYDWDTVWDATRGAATGTSANYTGAYPYAPELVNNFSTDFSQSLARAFYPFDTSALDDGATITAATLNLYCKEKRLGIGSGSTYDYIGLVQTTQASETQLSTADFDQCGALNGATLGASAVTISTLSTTGYTSIALNATGLGWISKTGYTKLGLRVARDLLDADPTSVEDDSDKARFYCSEQTGTDKDPYLEITAEAGSVQGFVFIIN